MIAIIITRNETTTCHHLSIASYFYFSLLCLLIKSRTQNCYVSSWNTPPSQLLLSCWSQLSLAYMLIQMVPSMLKHTANQHWFRPLNHQATNVTASFIIVLTMKSKAAIKSKNGLASTLSRLESNAPLMAFSLIASQTKQQIIRWSSW